MRWNNLVCSVRTLNVLFFCLILFTASGEWLCYSTDVKRAFWQLYSSPPFQVRCSAIYVLTRLSSFCQAWNKIKHVSISFGFFYSLSLLINSCSFREIYFGYSNFSSSARTRFVFIFVLKRVVAPRCLLFKGSKSFNRVLPLQLLPKLTFETNIVDRKYEFLGQLKWCNKQEGECSSPLIGLACEHNF